MQVKEGASHIHKGFGGTGGLSSGKGHQPSPGLNSKQLRVEFNIPKNYLDCFYPPEKRAEITKLSIVSKNLTGELDLSDFVNLEKLNCSYNYELSSLNLSNCLRLKKIECIHNSQLTNLTFPINLTNLKKLRLIYSSLEQNLSFLTGAVNLKELDLRDNKFTGSLDYLSNLKKLEYLDISSTDINEVNIDKLPKSLKCIAYSTTKSPHCQLTSITLQLEKCKYAFCQKCQQPNTSED
ncbi:1595_t:CDS:2 [Racocetra persica]|uniref:1595_t:CDS:1 n=1 Tax=Racocetra persica TaxID=160502 RepID=A0ACA9L115_9GLOM|nr:1595_t:CDS:2 [Racocetra persica]